MSDVYACEVCNKIIGDYIGQINGRVIDNPRIICMDCIIEMQIKELEKEMEM